MLSLSNCRKNIGGFSLDIDRLVIPDSGFCILVGPNGSGKSTLFGILSGRDSDYEGKFALDGRELRSFRHEELFDLFERANACGALATQKKGALSSFPRLSEVEGYLSRG